MDSAAAKSLRDAADESPEQFDSQSSRRTADSDAANAEDLPVLSDGRRLTVAHAEGVLLRIGWPDSDIEKA